MFNIGLLSTLYICPDVPRIIYTQCTCAHPLHLSRYLLVDVKKAAEIELGSQGCTHLYSGGHRNEVRHVSTAWPGSQRVIRTAQTSANPTIHAVLQAFLQATPFPPGPCLFPGYALSSECSRLRLLYNPHSGVPATAEGNGQWPIPVCHLR